MAEKTIREENMLFLREHFPDLAAYLEKAEPRPLDPRLPESPEDAADGPAGSGDGSSAGDSIAVVGTAAGVPSLVVNGKYIHSPRDPIREGLRAAETLPEGDGPIAALGFGLGYAVIAAAERFPQRPVVIVERRVSVLRAALETRDLRQFLSSRRAVFVLGNAGDPQRAVGAALRLFEGKPEILRNRALMALDGDWFGKAEKQLKFYIAKDGVNRNTLKKFGKRWVRNLAANMEAIRDIPGVELLSSCLPPEMPVLLVAAGPSLDEIAPLLPRLAERAVVAAVDTALRMLLRAGTPPDFVLAVDPQFWNARHLDRVPFPASCFVAESAVYPPVMRHSFGRAFLCSSLFPLGKFIENRVDPKGALGTGGSVATTAWDFARVLGTESLWLAGLDLSFPSLKTHFKGALFEERALALSGRLFPAETRSFHALRDGFPFSAPALCGGTVLTDRRLSLYASWFENRIGMYPRLKNRSFSVNGIAIPGLIPARAEELLALPPRREEINCLLAETFARAEAAFFSEEAAAARNARYKESRRELFAGLEKIRGLAEKAAGLAEGARAGEKQRVAAGRAGERRVSEETARALDELEKANQEISGSEVKDVAGFIFPSIGELEDGLESGPDSETERHLELSARFYRALAGAADYHLKVFQGLARNFA
ncbi:MAG: DUF115 domain-containing protein [Spirochaetaceae bacterium]|nr:DUF115 domain-containing protein [Spirochaetaceae bacterium]